MSERPPGGGLPESGIPGTTPSPPSPFERFTAALGLQARAFRQPFRPAAWLVPLAIVIGVQIASGLILRDLIVSQGMEKARESIQQNEQLSADQREEALERVEASRGAIGATAIVGPIFAVLASCLVTALVLMLIINFGLGGSVAFASLWVVAALSWAPKAIESILFTILARARSSIEVSFSPAAFVSDDAGTIRRVLALFDVFDFWMIAIQVVGVGVVAALAKGKARTAVFVLWIAYWLIASALLFATRGMPGMM